MDELYLIVKKYIDEYDFDDLLGIGAPYDEYDLESKEIATLITKDSSVDEIAAVISSVMNSSFDFLIKVDVNKAENFMEIATKIKNDLPI